MEAKDKAKELVYKFRGALPPQQATPFDMMAYAKACAIICVDEVLESVPAAPSPYKEDSPFTCQSSAKKYWQQVKEEIKTL